MADKITFDDKSHILPYGEREVQVWDLDINEIKAVVNTNADQLEGLEGGYQGELLIADTPTEDGYYMAGESGTYPNAGNVVVDLTQGITFINVSETQTVFTTTVIPIETYPPNTGDFDATDNVYPATQKSTSDWVNGEILSKNPLVELYMPKIPFNNGQEIYLGSFIKDLKITFSDDFNPYKNDGDLRRLRVNTINYLSATQVYISWVFELANGGIYSISGTDYYVDIGGDISNISGSYSKDFGEGIIYFDFTFDFSNIVESIFTNVSPDFTNGKIDDSVILDSFVNDYYKISKLNDDGTLNDEYVVNKEQITIPDINGLTYELYRNNETVLDSGKNLYNEVEKNKTSGYLDANGNIQSGTGFITNHIQIFEGLEYAYQGFYAAITNFCTYDKDYVLVNSYQTGTATGTFTPLVNELYVRFSVRNENEFMLELGDTQSTYESFTRVIDTSLLPSENNKFAGLKVVTFGDSITMLTDNWTTSFKTLTGVTDLINMAISGQKICWRAGTTETVNPPSNANDNNVFWNSILKYQNLYPTDEPDVIIIALGTNDISQASPLGSYDDAFAQDEASTSQQTMAGAYRKAIFKLMTDYPNTQIFYSTPIQSITGGRNYTTLTEVSDINNEISARMNTKIIDSFHKSGIYEGFENDSASGRYLYDGTHPNEAGALMMGKCISTEFEKLYYFDS